MKLIIIITLVVAFFLLFLSSVVFATPQIATGQCQYSERPLVNGQCDNSDPCDPTTIKDPVLHGNCAPEIKNEVKTEVEILPKSTSLK